MTEIFPGQFRLARVQLINWGTFSGYVDMPIARRGHLITGGSGSGKSTLLDAMSAVLVPPAKVRYNEAAQQGLSREQGRSLTSYIRGAWRRREDTQTGGIASTFLRSKATYTVVGLTYDNGNDEKYTLVGLFYLKSGDTSYSDVQKLYGTIPEDIDVRDFEQYLKVGIDKRKIKSSFPHARFSDQYRVFADYFRPRLGMHTEEAQLLLHRTQSAKSLSSLDQLFRDFMLERPSTFALAEESVEQFDDLRQTYRRLIDVREQIAVLQPLVKWRDQRDGDEASKKHALTLKQAFPTVRDQLQLEASREDLLAVANKQQAINSVVAQLETELGYAFDQYNNAQNALNQQGDGRLRILDEQAARVRERRDRRLADLEQVKKALAAVGAAMPTDASGFALLKTQAREIEANSPAQIAEWEDQKLANEVERHGLRSQRVEIENELQSLGKRTSNIDHRFIRVREQICEELQVTEQELPFAGELIDVSRHHLEWEPVIQRLLGAFATTLLVPDRLSHAINRYVNSRDLRIRLVYRTIPDHVTSARGNRSSRALSNKLDFVDAAMSVWVRNEILRAYDYECVESERELDALDNRKQGVTLAGLVRHARYKDGSTGYVKDDRNRLGNKTLYRLGSANDDKIELLRADLDEVEKKITAAGHRIHELGRKITRERTLINEAQKLAEYSYDQIDVSVDDAQLDALEKQRQDILSSPELQQLQQRVDDTKRHHDKINAQYIESRSQQSRLTEKVESTERDIAHLEETQRSRPQVDEAISEELGQRIGLITRRMTRRNLSEVTDKIIGELDENTARCEKAIERANQQITRILADYIAKWPAEKAELQADYTFAGEAINRLTMLRRDRLGEFESEFLAFMNDTSAKSLGALANTLRHARSDIETRLQPVNDSLGRSEFNPGRWLRVEVRDNSSKDAVDFRNDLTAATSGALAATRKKDMAHAEERYRALSVILDRLGSENAEDKRWRTLVLDTRLHVRFIASEVEADGTITNTYVDSASLSGGQAQKLVFFCLAAALRFRLAEVDEDYPRYATVVLDEAFDRADPAFTRTAMNIFTEFGFHMVLATPLKLIQTLSPYVDGTIVINYAEGTDASGYNYAHSGWAMIDSTESDSDEIS